MIAVVGDAPSVDELADVDWSHVASSLAPLRMIAAGGDSRWTVRYAVARDTRGLVQGIVPLFRSRVARPPYTEYDPHVIAPGLCGSLSPDARDWLLIGGRSDLAAGAAVRAALSPPQARRMRRELVREAVSAARTEGLTAVAMYVHGDEIDPFVELLGASATAMVEQACVLPVSVADPAEYPSGSPRRTRRIKQDLARDLRRIADAGLHSQPCPASDAVLAAAPLICAVKARHAIPDHPRLVQLRLNAWAAARADTSLAFQVRDTAGELVAVSFFYDDGRVLEGYEIGLADTHEHRHHAYLEAMIYAPFRYAQRRGLASIELGLGSTAPKVNRGATLRPVWAAVDPVGGVGPPASRPGRLA
jgi:hypothetical protein